MFYFSVCSCFLVQKMAIHGHRLDCSPHIYAHCYVFPKRFEMIKVCIQRFYSNLL